MVDNWILEGLEALIRRYPQLACVEEEMIRAYEIMQECFLNKKKLLVGGKGSDAEHVVGELLKSFLEKRELNDRMKEKLAGVDQKLGSELTGRLQEALPAMTLHGNLAFSTACQNDIDGSVIYAQQLYAYGNEGDVLLAISTSGNSKNILYSVVVAKAKGMKVIGLTGKSGGRLAELADVVIKAPEDETYKIQELHLPIYHWLCMALEKKFYGGCSNG